MRLYRYLYNNIVEIGIEVGNKIQKISKYNNIVDLLEDGFNNSGKIKGIISQDFRNKKDIKILSPIEKPIHDIICVGKNYVDHISELGGDTTEEFVPNYFGKRASIIKGHKEEIKGIYEIDNQVDYEVELAAIISKNCKNIERKNAKDYIFGLSIFNDVSSRYLQNHHKQWYRGKSVDEYSILGPCIVTVDEFEFPLKLELKSFVNKEMRQFSNTSKMIISIEEIIEDLSKTMTLELGDIIATGTPSGVGKGFNPPRYINKGDIVELEIENIGKLENKFI
ncbi:fumarylacetoacetate hydrolase family protein [Miniphocaeibacter massiliensis]|uniref:fumarylacetoacetate hydrolase family protein n=1 Tax=Miniphocaeibacter massiliensis TaxID=2041841 RepID=UPI000C1C030F|nr:fumarylacetoacetate hydrolase family protein [Miniphocaeibacter massiliensis]